MYTIFGRRGEAARVTHRVDPAEALEAARAMRDGGYHGVEIIPAQKPAMTVEEFETHLARGG